MLKHFLELMHEKGVYHYLEGEAVSGRTRGVGGCLCWRDLFTWDWEWPPPAPVYPGPAPHTWHLPSPASGSLQSTHLTFFRFYVFYVKGCTEKSCWHLYSNLSNWSCLEQKLAVLTNVFFFLFSNIKRLGLFLVEFSNIKRLGVCGKDIFQTRYILYIMR